MRKPKPVAEAPCKDCGKDTEPWENGKPLCEQFDMYLVRDEIWAEANMVGWKSGYLCTTCLSKRLGRDLTYDDYLARTVGVTDKALQFEVQPEYLNHPSVKRIEDKKRKNRLRKQKQKSRKK